MRLSQVEMGTLFVLGIVLHQLCWLWQREKPPKSFTLCILTSNSYAFLKKKNKQIKAFRIVA